MGKSGRFRRVRIRHGTGMKEKKEKSNGRKKTHNAQKEDKESFERMNS